jgi:seryl-tRNA synthetase
MSEQLESLIPDTEIADACEEIAGTLAAAFDLLLERRDTAYTLAVKPLDTEIASLRQETAAIAEARTSLEKILPAKQRTAQAEADALLLAGKAAEAEVKQQEVEEAKHALEQMHTRQQEILSRIEGIEAEKRAVAKRVFDSWFGECQGVIRPIEHGLFCVILDGLRDSFFQFQTETDTAEKFVGDRGLFHVGHLADLTAPERSPEWVAGQRWYKGRT